MTQRRLSAIARISRFCSWAIGLSCGLVLGDQLLSGVLTSYIIIEDGPVENLSAVVFFVAALAAVITWFRAPRDRAALVSAAVAAIAIAGFLDEVSLGQRIFGWTPPVVRGKSIDGLHDFFDVGYAFIRQHFTGAQTAALVAVFAGACIGLLFTLRRGIMASAGESAAVRFVVLAVALVAMASVIDLDLVAPDGMLAFVYPLEEILELSAGWAILSGALVRWVETATLRR